MVLKHNNVTSRLKNKLKRY